MHTPGTIPARAGETMTSRRWQPASRDHPRSRGGNSGVRRCKFQPMGPSPLARGKPSFAKQCIHQRGDHPRSRGGNHCNGFHRCCKHGPSPLARGKHALGRDASTTIWTIPARAGETQSGIRRHTAFKGPSPLARGKLAAGLAFVALTGTIPARAGETTDRGLRSLPPWDHPRSRGGNRAKGLRQFNYWGPSPLARGKLRGILILLEAGGTIPARAGETEP